MMIKKYIDILLFNEATGIVQFFRYAVISAVALIFDVGLLMGLSWVGVHYLVAATIGFLFGVTVVYLGSIIWVFPKRTVSDRKKEITTFLLIGVAGLVLTDSLLYILVTQISLTLLIAKIATTILVFLFNFTARKFLLFT